MAALDERFRCPVCGRASSHPQDKAKGYCGNCHDFTAPPGGDIPALQRTISDLIDEPTGGQP